MLTVGPNETVTSDLMGHLVERGHILRAGAVVLGDTRCATWSPSRSEQLTTGTMAIRQASKSQALPACLVAQSPDSFPARFPGIEQGIRGRVQIRFPIFAEIRITRGHYGARAGSWADAVETRSNIIGSKVRP